MIDENAELFERMRAGEFPDGARVLRAKLDMILALLADPDLEERLAQQARLEFEAHFTGEQTYRQLMQLYTSFRPGLAEATRGALPSSA